MNTVSPVHIKQGSALQEILSRFVNMDGEKEELTAYGDTLMRAGIALKPAFAGTGYNSDTRLFPDFPPEFTLWKQRNKIIMLFMYRPLSLDLKTNEGGRIE